MPITDVTYAGDESVVLSLADQTLRVWDAGLSAEQFSLQTDQQDVLWSVAASPDGNIIAGPAHKCEALQILST